MKTILFIFFTLITINCTAQMSGVPEQDSLLELKDKLFLKAGKNSIEYQWVRYQWLQWVGGEKKKFCVYRHSFLTDGTYTFFTDDTYIAECPQLHPGGLLIVDKNYLGDTLIYIPRPISFKGFMDWKVGEKLKEEN